MSTIKRAEYDEVKKFLDQLEMNLIRTSEREISRKIRSFIKENFEQNPPEILLWEQMAFDFTENYPNDKSSWETYFGPMYVFLNEEGKIVECPSIQKITPEIISYWEQRAKEAVNPIFKARYSNLVWDFSERIKGERPHYSIAQICIDSVIEIAERDLYKYPVYIIRKLERALFLALSINDKKRINSLIETIINYENKTAEDDKPGLWGFSYELLVKNKKIQLDEDKEQNIINDLHERFERLLEGSNSLAIKKAAILLVDYYFRSKNQLKVKDVLLRFGNIVQKQAYQVSPLVANSWLEELYRLYLQYGLRNEANKILLKIKELGEKSLSEFEEIRVSINLSEGKIKNFINNLIEGDLKEVLTRIAIYYIPRREKIKKRLEDLFKETPIVFLFPQKIFDNKGRPISVVGPLEEDLEGHIVLQISRDMQLSSYFLRETIKALIEKFNLDVKSIVDYFYESPIFDVRRKEFFLRGIESYLNNDFLTSLHILISQIEAVIRNLAEKIGLPILKYTRFGCFNYRTLDDLLTDKEIIDVLTDDVCLYLRVLFTDPRGWNLRNNIYHGISPIETFNQISADRVFHALLCLSLVREKRAKE